ncbi:divergent polysaccharide deacetylase family protein [Gymnodinialimonas sp.]
MGGLSIGIFWGTLVSAVGLAALSLSSPLPPRGGAEAVEAAVEVPVAGTDGAEAVAEEAVGAVGAVGEEEAALEAAAEAAVSVAPEGGTEAAPAPPDAAPEAEAEEASEPATEIPLPSGSEFNRPPPEPEAALPAPDAAPQAAAPQAPALAGDVIAPVLDTAPAAQPSVAAEAPAQIATVAGESAAPTRPAASSAPVIASGPTALTQPEASATPQVRTALLPQVTEAPEDAGVEAEEVAAATEPEPVPLLTPVFPTIGDGATPDAVTPEVPEDVASGGAIDAPAEEAAAVSTPAFPQTSTLPQVAAQIEPQLGEDAEIAEDPAPALADDLPAIQAFAAPFDTAEERPLMAVVLIDEPDSRIELSTLTRFTFPVAFAVDPLHPEAAARAAAYREAGFEVVILGAMIAEGATAADTEVALAAAASTLPEAVAVLDTPEGRIQGDRPVLDAMVSALSESGHGLVAFPRGLNAAEQSASRAGVPGATVFRFLDDEDQRATVITRFLSRAAFAAAQEGSVIVVGRTRPDTVTALFSWALGGRSEAVALAPLSATLLRGAGE